MNITISACAYDEHPEVNLQPEGAMNFDNGENLDTIEVRSEFIPNNVAMDSALTLKMSALKSAGARVETTEKGYRVVFASKKYKRDTVRQMILSSNDVEVFYSDDLEDNDQINISKKPLWTIKEVNGTFFIDRTF